MDFAGPRLTLGRWFLLWMLLVTMVALGLSVAVVTLRQNAVLRQQLLQRGRNVARSVAATAANREVDASTLALTVAAECVAISVTTADGHTLWSFGPPRSEALKVDPGLLEVDESYTPTGGGSKDRVRVQMLMSTTGIRAQVLDAGARLALTLGAALGAALLGGALLVNRVVEPLRELAEAVRVFQPNSPPQIVVPTSGAGEVIELAATFRQMAERLGDQRRLIFDEMADGVALIDPAGTPLLVNRAMEEDLEEVLPETVQVASDLRRHQWEVSIGDRILHCALTRPEGLENRILVARDVTEWKFTEERLREAQKMEAVATLAGGVAHDFNNLLAGILLHVRLLEHDPEAAEASREAIRALAEEGSEVVGEMLRFAHPESTPYERVELDHLVAEQEALLSHMLPATIALKVVCSAAAVRGSDSELRRVVLNLVLNARNALADSGGEVVVRVAQADGNALLEVADNGPGIPPELRDRIFEPFFSLRREGRGAGIGLAVVYAIVREHDGRISVHESPGGGARFVIRLPLETGEAAAEAADV